jgi:DNA polymerase
MSEQPFTGNPHAPQVVVLDFETRSPLDLRKVGATKVAQHPLTDVWCAAYAAVDQPVRIWLPGDPPPPDLFSAAAVVAHNAAGFEYVFCRHIMTPRYGWPDIPLERWRCTMTLALSLALPPALGKLAKVLNLKHQKGDDQIMHQMARPRKPRGDEDPSGIYWHDDLDHLHQLYAYCRADVECERELWQVLSC